MSNTSSRVRIDFVRYKRDPLFSNAYGIEEDHSATEHPDAPTPIPPDRQKAGGRFPNGSSHSPLLAQIEGKAHLSRKRPSTVGSRRHPESVCSKNVGYIEQAHPCGQPAVSLQWFP